MKVVIFGATGMVAKGVLLECLDDRRVERVLLVSRQSVGISDPKIASGRRRAGIRRSTR